MPQVWEIEIYYNCIFCLWFSLRFYLMFVNGMEPNSWLFFPFKKNPKHSAHVTNQLVLSAHTDLSMTVLLLNNETT